MKIATFNVNGITSRLPHLLRWLERDSPDVACLQELKTVDSGFPFAAIRKAGYDALWQGQRSWNGVAILARSNKLVEVRRGLPGDPDDTHSRYLEAAVDGILIACIYLPNGNPRPGPKFDYKLAWFRRLNQHAAKLWKSGKPVVLAGDFNVVPTDFDIYNPQHWRRDALLRPESRECYAQLLQQGWVDALRTLHPDQPLFTFWDHFRNHWARNAGLRIDHLLLSRTLAPRLTQAGVDRWMRGQSKPSDHAPAWVVLDMKKKAVTNRKAAAHAATGHAMPAGALKRAAPATLSPMLATLVDAPPSTPEDWLYEVKFDGYRILARVSGRDIRLFTRNGNDWTAKLPHLVKALQKLQLKPGWLDGEIVVRTAGGGTSFQALQGAFETARTADIACFLFDVPFYNGHDLREVPLIERRRFLRDLLGGATDPVRYSEDFVAAPAELVRSACKLGLEGIIGKRKDSPYSSRRSPQWIKLKCSQRQEFVIGGWTEPAGSRTGFGALLIGVHDADGKLSYAGKVGTGFNERSLAELHKQLKALAAGKSPFQRRVPREKHAHWVKPTLVAEITFSEWTRDGHLRHPVFHALRTDKPAKAIIREQPQHALGPDMEQSTTALPARLRLTHPERVIDKSTRLTKLDVVRHYAAVGQLMMEHLQSRPVAMLRAPQGIEGQQFFQKHMEQARMEDIRRLDRRLDPEHAPLMEVESAYGLLSAAQINVIEFHSWNAIKTDIAHPDRMTFDLDPGEGVKWPMMQQAAELMRETLTHLQLPAFLKTSGGKGLHVVVPIRRQHDWDTVKGFSKSIVEQMARAVPKIFVAKSGPRNRVGRIFIDYLRNGFGATTVAAWSLRARPGMGVSVPIAWNELSHIESAAQWTLRNAGKRLALGNQPWADYARSARSLGTAMKKLGYKLGA